MTATSPAGRGLPRDTRPPAGTTDPDPRARGERREPRAGRGRGWGGGLRDWLLADLSDRRPQNYQAPKHEHRPQPWWRVMCLTGVDYFSTLGYQPGIAALAAGLLSPMATVVLVVLTLAGALPVYRRVAAESPRGQGSISMLEKLLSLWKGKLFVLVLLGFAATDFIITMTLSAADATAHLVENPHAPSALQGHNVLITLALLTLLGVVFLRGFGEAINVAVVLVVVYLSLNVVVVVVGFAHIAAHPGVFHDWTTGLTHAHGSPVAMVGISLLVFPKLALGMSGFETGVAVMPQVRGAADDDPEHPAGRIAGTRRLLTVAAVTMSIFLVATALITTLLIPAAQFKAGGQANGRALAFLAHEYLGSGFGTVYDASTIAILWFAGASAMAGMLNLIPRYLPRYGMAPQWARASRPLTLVLIAVAFLITWLFDASVDKQGGAYATGVLVLMSSAAVAVTLAARRRGQRGQTAFFAVVSVVFVYTTLDNVVERPDGVKIGACFILAIVATSLWSRLRRSFELRTVAVEFDAKAEVFLRDCARRTIRLVANEPDAGDIEEYDLKTRQILADNDMSAGVSDVIFVEVTVGDPSEFEDTLRVHGCVRHGSRRVITLEASSVPNALAALLLEIRDLTGVIPHIYFEWTEGTPVAQFLRFLFFGVGEVAPVTREVLRRAEPDRTRRPHVHVG